jgi:5-methylcytosine-specific restriction endonuclease McrA
MSTHHRTAPRVGQAVERSPYAADRRAELAIWLLRRLPYRDYLRTAHWTRIRALALERAHFACALCPATAGLEVHHRCYARKGFEQPEDLVVLCWDCHRRHHGTLTLLAGRENRYEPIRAPLIPASSIRWLMKGG